LFRQGATRPSVATRNIRAGYRHDRMSHPASVADPTRSRRISKARSAFRPFHRLLRSFHSCHTANMSYEAVHRQARRRLRAACQRCRTTTSLQAALNPAAPQSNLRLDAQRNAWYSVDPADYLTLCATCHYRMDRRLRNACARFQRARRRAPRCNVCGQPMMAGQQGAHLSCSQAVAADRYGISVQAVAAILAKA
jgi:hypothetical protein